LGLLNGFNCTEFDAFKIWVMGLGVSDWSKKEANLMTLENKAPLSIFAFL
jgi:hypothetical protein